MPLGDPEEIDAILTSYKMGLEEGERQTVEKIVAWLKTGDHEGAALRRILWERIEAGEWK